MLATVAEAQKDRVERQRWGPLEELLATLIEVVDRGDRWFFQANATKGSAAPEPIVIPRPGSNGKEPEPQPPRMATVAEMNAFFFGGP